VVEKSGIVRNGERPPNHLKRFTKKKGFDMGQRGPKNRLELSVVPSSVIGAIKRPDPPAHLTDAQADVWISVVDCLPADWFPTDVHGTLEQYCRHVVAARKVAQLVEQFEASDDLQIEEYDRLLKMQEREGRALSSLATRLRITPQARHHARKDAGKGKVKKPWEN